MNNDKPQPDAPTQGQRWFRYGLNVTLLVVALGIIVFLLNLAAWRWPVRIDFTHNRRYTLSPQTQKVIDALKTPVTLTTLYLEDSDSAAKLAEVEDLLEAYRLRGEQVATRHIDPARDVAQYELLVAEITTRFAPEIKLRRDAVAVAKERFAGFLTFAAEQAQPLGELVVAMPGASEKVADIVTSLNEFFGRAPEDLGRVEAEIDKRFAGAMPDFEPVRAMLGQVTGVYLQNLTGSVEFCTRLINDDTTPAAAKELLSTMRDGYRGAMADLATVAEAVDRVGMDRYEETRVLLSGGGCVIVSLPYNAAEKAEGGAADNRGMVALTLDEIFPQYVESGEQAYKGEERITGSLLQLTLRHKTRVVFVNPSGAPALRGRVDQIGSYQAVAQRLRAMNFAVEEWQPAAGMRPGERTPPVPNLTPKDGETLIFISLAAAPNPDMPINPAADIAGDAIKVHVAAGRPAMIFTFPDESYIHSPDSPSPLAALAPFGITVEREKLVVAPMAGRERGAGIAWRPEPTRDHAISRAVLGVPGVFTAAQRIGLKEVEGVESWALIQSPSGTWAEEQALPLSNESFERYTRDEGEEGGPITVAVAAQKGETRIVVVAAPFWASDTVVLETIGVMGNSLSDISSYSRFPMNAELFVNSVFWLAGLDDVIAPGAKSQDTRRLGDIGAGQRSAIRWGLGVGMPVACLLAGVVVWFVRRR